ncbi:MAG: hypothetical protein V1772_03355 [Chloroflexota bacterium]
MSTPSKPEERRAVPAAGPALWQRIPPDVRRGVRLGALIAAATCLVVGGIFGALNRGVGGTVIGAVSGALLGTMIGALVGAIMALFYPRGEAGLRITIDVDSAAGRYVPGETITGSVQVSTDGALRTEGGSILLRCRGAFVTMNGTDPANAPKIESQPRQYLLQQVHTFPPAALRRGQSARYPFSVTIPEDALPTHHGYACSVRWGLLANVDVPGRDTYRAEQELLVEAPPLAIQPSPSGFESARQAEPCRLTLRLARAVCAEGDPLKAEVDILPHESFYAKEVRALLLRIEHTPQGDDHVVYVSRWDPATGHFHGERYPGGKGTTYVWLEDEAQLSGPVHFQKDQAETFACTLSIPAQWRPTLLAKEGEVIWKACAIMACEHLEDVRALHEVLVHTGVSRLGDVLSPEPAAS